MGLSLGVTMTQLLGRAGGQTVGRSGARAVGRIYVCVCVCVYIYIYMGICWGLSEYDFGMFWDHVVHVWGYFEHDLGMFWAYLGACFRACLWLFVYVC